MGYGLPICIKACPYTYGMDLNSETLIIIQGSESHLIPIATRCNCRTKTKRWNYLVPLSLRVNQLAYSLTFLVHISTTTRSIIICSANAYIISYYTVLYQLSRYFQLRTHVNYEEYHVKILYSSISSANLFISQYLKRYTCIVSIQLAFIYSYLATCFQFCAFYSLNQLSIMIFHLINFFIFHQILM